MSDLKFADTHNLVGFWEKPTESEGFKEIVGFLNANPIKYALNVNPTIYCSCIKQFWDTVKAKTVNGEVQLQVLVDKKKVIITESTIRRDLQLEDANCVDCLPNAAIFEQLTLMGKSKKKNIEVPQPSGSTKNVPDENKVLDLEKAKTVQDSEIATLKKKVKKLERRNKSRTLGLKRLKKVGSARRVESSNEASLGDQEDASKQGRKIADIDADAEEVKVEKVVSTAKVTTKSATTTTVDELTLAQTLIEIKAAKPKVRGVMIQEPSEFTTTTPAASKPSQDKGKAKMIEFEEPLKMKPKDQHFAAKRAEERRSKPPTKAQQRSIMTTYLKNMAEWKPEDLKNKSFASVQELFENAMKSVNTFVDIYTELVEGSEIREEESSSKRAGDELEQEPIKKQKVDDDKEREDLQQCFELVTEEDVAIDAIPLATKPAPIINF
ncbi:hypothetical protein Tco_0468558 [Tanacetum coccineum]